MVAFGRVRASPGYALAAYRYSPYGTSAQRGPQPVGTLPRASYECGDLEKSGLPFCEMSAGHHFMCGHSQYVGADTWIDALLAHNRTACSAGLVPVPSASEATWPMEGSQGERGREGCRQGSPFPAFIDNGLRFCADCIPCAQCSGRCLRTICACHAGPERYEHTTGAGKCSRRGGACES